MTKTAKKIAATIIPLGGSLLMAVLLCGCSAMTAGTVVETYPSTVIKEKCWLLAQKVQVTRVDSQRVNDLLNVQITAYNRTRHDWQFEYRYRWLKPGAAAGSMFEEKTGLTTWNTVYSGARDTIRMSAVAPNSDVTDFEFMVRFPDRW